VIAEGLVGADAAAIVRADRADDVPVEVLLPQPGQVLAHHDVVVEEHHPPKLREELLEQARQTMPIVSTNKAHQIQTRDRAGFVFTSGRWILR